MICYTDYLDTAINAGCPTTFGMERNGYLCLRSEINPKTETDLVVDFVPRLMIPIYQPSENAYKPKSEGERNAYGLTKYQKSIEVFLVANTELSQEQIMWLKDEDWVAVLKQIDGTVIVFGFERGLRLKTSSQDLNSTDFHGGILLTFDENMVNSPMLFGAEALYDWQDFDIIYGGKIAASGLYEFAITPKTLVGYVKLPNGEIKPTVEETLVSIISGTSTLAGDITYYIPKAANYAAISGLTVVSGLSGSITSNFAHQLFCNGTDITTMTFTESDNVNVINAASLANLIAPKATEIYASGCDLTAKSIGDILYAAYFDNRENVVYDFSGGTNALEGAVDTYLQATYGVTYAAVYALLVTTNSGTISIDTV